MKNYPNLRAVCHAYANQTSQDGQSSSIYFQGRKAYSYGTHYVLAEKFDGFTVLNDVGYSSSTSKHINYMLYALWGKQYATTNIIPKLVLIQLKTNISKLEKARKPQIYIDTISSLINIFNIFWNDRSINDFTSICGYTISSEDIHAIKNIEMSFISDPTFAKYREDETKRKEEAKIKENERRKKEERKNRKLHKESVKKFRNYESNYVSYKPMGFEELLRVSKDGLFVETSQSAKVTIESAKVLYSMILAKKDIKGHVIDGYTVISINGVLTIGCHRINIKSVHSVGAIIINL